MNNSENLKGKLIDHLMERDLEKMDMKELREYTEIVNRIVDMERPGYAECLSMLNSGFCASTTKEAS